jgi:two-component system nitrate/nitrite response regulator NarP
MTQVYEAALKYKLSMRQTEVLKWIMLGLRAKDIGLKMGLTEGTVKQYLHTVYEKMGVRNRSELAWKVLG